MIEGEIMTKKVGAKKSVKSLQKELSELEEQIAKLKTKLDYRPNYARSVSDPRLISWARDKVLLRRLKSRRKSLKWALKRDNESTNVV